MIRICPKMRWAIQITVDAYSRGQLDMFSEWICQYGTGIELIDKITSRPTHFTEGDVLVLLPNLSNQYIWW